MKLNLHTHSSKETLELGMKIGQRLHAGSVLAFYGDLAAGKTTLIKGICQQVGQIPNQEVSSPTFTYLNIYDGDPLTVYHFDLYRLKNAEQFLQMGFDEYFSAGGICCLEWSERIKGYLPQERIDIHIEHESGGRNIIIESFYEEVSF